MEIRQMTVEDWLAEFCRNPKAVSQVRVIERRMERGLPLATWEYNCVEAHRMVTRQHAAE